MPPRLGQQNSEISIARPRSLTIWLNSDHLAESVVNYGRPGQMSIERWFASHKYLLWSRLAWTRRANILGLQFFEGGAILRSRQAPAPATDQAA
jgi:hypothetical protein